MAGGVKRHAFAQVGAEPGRGIELGEDRVARIEHNQVHVEIFGVERNRKRDGSGSVVRVGVVELPPRRFARTPNS